MVDAWQKIAQASRQEIGKGLPNPWIEYEGDSKERCQEKIPRKDDEKSC